MSTRRWPAVGKAAEESAVNRTLAANAEEKLLALSGWKGLDNPWVADAEDHVEYSYINLLVNPERYTGYTVRVK
jgi:ERO1-like protein alpha